MENKAGLLKPFLLIIIGLDIFIWCLIIFQRNISGPEFYFLKVGQGDSSFVVLPGNRGDKAKFLIDGGPIGGGLDSNLEMILPPADRYIDVVFISHPQIDHFGGLIDVFKKYKIGAVFYNGEEGDDPSWKELNSVISDKNIRKIVLKGGDAVSYGISKITVLNSAGSANSNDSGLALVADSGGIRTLFMADFSAEAEKSVAVVRDVGADILKVSHHGSKYSSDLSFLKKVSPKISVIEVGKNNYGHPAKEVLDRLAEVGSKIFRTDQDGIIKIKEDNGIMRVFKL